MINLILNRVLIPVDKFIFIFLSLFLVGCEFIGYTLNVSNHMPYKQYMNRDLVLSRPMLLCKVKQPLPVDKKTFSSRDKNLYLMEEKQGTTRLISFEENNICANQFIELPAGTILKVKSTKHYHSVDFSFISVEGEVFDATTNRSVPFEYDLGSEIDLPHMPWEIKNK
jgi:hypothetical protein